ncbi:MAG: putative nicotinate-nucleotide adenylyltransferase [Alphaproteobacteria bacterium ADurb.BinA280]|jgi:nicotinate-nucleotide adenylyltransferase|nr:MAG: putative nicotinate-nucleotide adenylyltransferase [Alphaproteobacteria bacterium ADurb.BinA280]
MPLETLDSGHFEKPLVVLGGTFDPVHRTHIALACAARDALGAEVCLIPNADPPHRARPLADAAHRMAMLQLAIAPHANLRVDARELQRSGPSYMVDTLDSLRADVGPHRSLSLLLGSDAFAGITQWHQSSRLVDLANLLVAIRPAADAAAIENTLQRCHWSQRWATTAELTNCACGRIASLSLPPSSDSSTDLRAALGACRALPASMIAEVAAYIAQHRLYQ